MVHYRRNRVAGGTYFYTINLRDRSRPLLSDRGYVTRAVNRPHSTIHRYVKVGTFSEDWACDPLEGEFGEGK